MRLFSASDGFIPWANVSLQSWVWGVWFVCALIFLSRFGDKVSGGWGGGGWSGVCVWGVERWWCLDAYLQMKCAWCLSRPVIQHISLRRWPCVNLWPHYLHYLQVTILLHWRTVLSLFLFIQFLSHHQERTGSLLTPETHKGTRLALQQVHVGRGSISAPVWFLTTVFPRLSLVINLLMSACKFCK